LSTTNTSNITLNIFGPPKSGKSTLVVAALGANALYLSPKPSSILEAGRQLGLDLSKKVIKVNTLREVNTWTAKMKGKGAFVVADDLSLLVDKHVRAVTVLDKSASVWDAFRDAAAELSNMLLDTVTDVEGFISTNWLAPTKFDESLEVLAQAKPLMPGMLLPDLYPGLFDGVVAMTALKEGHEGWALRHPTHKWCLQTQCTPEVMSAIRLSKTVKTYSPLSLRELLLHCGRDIAEPWKNHDKAVVSLVEADDVRKVFGKVRSSFGEEKAYVALGDARARAHFQGLGGDSREDDVFGGIE